MHAGSSNGAGNSNVFLGYAAGYNAVDTNNTLYIANNGTTTPLIYGEFDHQLLRVNGTLEIPWAGSDTNPNHNILALSGDNQGTGGSDVGFSLENKANNIAWTFRTYDPSKGFAISKIGTGGNEFKIDNPTNDVANTVVKYAGVTVFENGHTVTASSRDLKTNIKPLDTQTALVAFHKLQPVSYNYKAYKDEPVVGFIAEDIPQLVAMPSRKTLDSTEIVAVLTSVVQEQDKKMVEMEAKIAKLESMQKRVAQLESLLTNLALDASKTDKTKVSLNLK